MIAKLADILRQKIGSDNTHYVHGLRGIQSQVANSAWTEAMSDGLGSVRGWLNSSQAFTDTNDYAPYGVPDSAVTGFGFTGEMTDDNRLVYLRARYYDPTVGVFTSLDPFEGVHNRPMSVNGYSWVEGNVANWVDPSGMCAFWVGLCGAAFAFAGPTGFDDVLACGAAAFCLGSVSELIRQLSQIFGPTIANTVAQILGQVQVQPQVNEFDGGIMHMVNPNYTPTPTPSPGPAPEPHPTLILPYNPVTTATPENNDCPTNHSPGSQVQFDSANEMEDIMCNIRKHTALNGPQPYMWWQSLYGIINPIIGDAWQSIQGAFITGQSGSFREISTNQFRNRRVINGYTNSMFIPRPGNHPTIRTRADVMAIVVHEMRHAGQFHSLFRNETVRGQTLNCYNISPRIGEVDAWMMTNHWMINSINSNLLGRTDFRDTNNFLNNGSMWSVDDLWDHNNITQYRPFYFDRNTGIDRFDVPSLNCPNSQTGSLNNILACTNPIVISNL